ncbi:reverse transcriptase [Elysia marginata]|uniref:Reverse transcriptase n=1 Tax=Elysia marginata TaxID=1093978 RepID=A0AAV4HG61_9GAST|nr:reverse transcriptase [Elysia marginata]
MLFLNQLNKEINNETDSTDEIICRGDFNTVLNNSLDIISGNPHNSETVSHLNAWARQLNLYDIWRLRNQKEKQFTWTRSNIARRLGYIFLGKSIYNLAIGAIIKSCAFSDHCPVTCTLSIDPRQRIFGPNKLNTSLLINENYINTMIRHILAVQEEEI